MNQTPSAPNTTSTNTRIRTSTSTSTSTNKDKKATSTNTNYRSPSIPAMIGSQNFEPCFLDDSVESMDSTQLGISRPSYGSPVGSPLSTGTGPHSHSHSPTEDLNHLDFSPMLQKQRLSESQSQSKSKSQSLSLSLSMRRTLSPKPKSALNKYTNPALRIGAGGEIEMQFPLSPDHSNVVKKFNPPPEETIQHAIVSTSASAQRLEKHRKSKKSIIKVKLPLPDADVDADVDADISDKQPGEVRHKKHTTSFRNPIKALLKSKQTPSTSIPASTTPIPVPIQQQQQQRHHRRPVATVPSSGADSVSTIDMDGSINLYRPVSEQVERAPVRPGNDNNRFFTPIQQQQQQHQQHRQSSYKSTSVSKSRRQRSRHDLTSSPSNHSLTSIHSIHSTNSINSQDTSLTTSTPDRKRDGLGISRAPRKSSSSRIIVPYVTPTDSKSKHLYTVFILLIQPTQKIFELVRINYEPATATLKDLLSLIPDNCTEEELSEQAYVGFIRPNGGSSSNKNLTNLALTASVMARDGSCARIVCGEVLASIPEGFTGKETQILSRHIMQNPKMLKLLSKKNPLSKKKASLVAAASASKKGSHLGIQPSNNYYNSENSGTFSSSVLFAPLTDSIDEEGGGGGTASPAPSPARKKLERQRSRGSIPRIGSGRNLMTEEDSCSSSISTATHTLNSLRDSERSGPSVHQVVSNIELKHKLQHLEKSVKSLKRAASSSKSRSLSKNRLHADDQSENNDSHNLSLTSNQLEEIKRQAAGAATEAAKVAARAAAEEAFSKRMEELIKTLHISEHDKNRLLENDDMSFHSTMSFAMNAAMTPLTGDYCDFPVTVSVKDSRPPSEVRMIQPHGSYGAYAVTSESKLRSQYAPPSGATLLSPISSHVKHVSPKYPDYEASPLSSNTCFSPKPLTPGILKLNDTFNKSMNTTFTQSTMSDDDDIDSAQASLIAETLEGFYEVAKRVGAKFLKQRKEKLRGLPEKILQQKLHLKLMSIVCVLFLSSQTLMRDDAPNKVHNVELVPQAQDEATSDKKFNLMDLQHILFWFLILTKGQNYVMRKKPQRKKRRAWKSRVIPAN